MSEPKYIKAQKADHNSFSKFIDHKKIMGGGQLITQNTLIN